MWNFRHFVFHLAARVVAAILCDSSQLFPPDGSKLDVCYTKLSLFELLPVKVKLFLSYQRVDFCLESFGSMEGTLFIFFFVWRYRTILFHTLHAQYTLSGYFTQ